MLIPQIPAQLRRPLIRSVEFCLDGRDLLLGRRKELVPPRYLNFTGNGDFAKTGDEFLEHFIRFGELRPEHNVLEVGCGIGRMARPLTKYLTTGTYEGFDIVPHGIRWCENHYRQYLNFHFQMADVNNPEYNSRGKVRASDYRFPFKDNQFDFVYLTSVFTHMLSEDMSHYLQEISRVLRPNRTCFITFFLLNDQSRNLMASGRGLFDFRFPLDGCWAAHERNPEAAIAYDETHVRELFAKNSLFLETLQFGSWCGRNNFLTFQDVLVARKSIS
jgi:ubiquinone/menaquinone biosynthesis C-methylase UbiE